MWPWIWLEDQLGDLDGDDATFVPGRRLGGGVDPVLGSDLPHVRDPLPLRDLPHARDPLPLRDLPHARDPLPLRDLPHAWDPLPPRDRRRIPVTFGLERNPAVDQTQSHHHRHQHRTGAQDQPADRK